MRVVYLSICLSGPPRRGPAAGAATTLIPHHQVLLCGEKVEKVRACLSSRLLTHFCIKLSPVHGLGMCALSLSVQTLHPIQCRIKE